jgi:catechol 2,3-dioxygenase-like lactoylglutathione lyase family enzyme
MLGYATIGVSDMEKAKAFYTPIVEAMGGTALFGFPRIQFFGKSMNEATFAICTPYDGEPNHPGNGNMIALRCTSRDQVDAMHALALQQGASCDGAPGERMPTFYGAYVKDPDGNKICFHILG